MIVLFGGEAGVLERSGANGLVRSNGKREERSGRVAAMVMLKKVFWLVAHCAKLEELFNQMALNASCVGCNHWPYLRRNQDLNPSPFVFLSKLLNSQNTTLPKTKQAVESKAQYIDKLSKLQSNSP